MQKKTKLIGNIIFMLLLLGATMYLLLKDQDLPEIRRLLQGASGSMILFAVVCGHVFDLGIHVLDRYIALAWRAYAFFSVAAVFFYRLFV